MLSFKLKEMSKILFLSDYLRPDVNVHCYPHW